jgi:holo-[acyl-carrier protein] synthase
MIPMGSGIDIVEIDRIKKIIEKENGVRFIEKILHKKEQEEYHVHHNQMAFLAKRFAVKEAMSKALGSGIGRDISFTDMYVEHDKLGKPNLAFTEETMQRLQLADKHIMLTIADERAYAVAHVMIFK